MSAIFYVYELRDPEGVCFYVGKGNSTRSRLPDEGRANIARASRGRTHTDETREKMRQAALGRTHSVETKKKISDIQLGKKRGPVSDEARARMSEAFKLRDNSAASARLKEINANRKGKPWSEARRLAQQNKGDNL